MADRLRWTGIRYRDPTTGRYITRAAVRTALEDSLTNVERLTESLADDLREGRIGLAEWRSEMRDVIKQVHLMARQVAVGGRAQMTPADNGAVGQAVRQQYRYLEAWTEQIKGGRSLNELESRSAQYLRSARTSFFKHEASVNEDAGFDEIRSILHEAEHCAECIAEAARDWVPIGSHVPIGERTCRHNDRCTTEYRNSETGQTFGQTSLSRPTQPPPEIPPAPLPEPVEVAPEPEAAPAGVDPTTLEPAALFDYARSTAMGRAVREFNGTFEEFKVAMSKKYGAGEREDGILLEAWQERGFDQLPAVADEAELNKIVKDGGLDLYRGFTASAEERGDKFAEDFRSGHAYAGWGGYGNGTYAGAPAVQKASGPALQYGVLDSEAGGEAKRVAGQYTYTTKDAPGARFGAMIRMVLKPGSKVTTFADLQEKADEMAKVMRARHLAEQAEATAMRPDGSIPEIPQSLLDKHEAEERVYMDMGRFGSMMGYDAYFTGYADGGGGYFVVLNRGAVVVEDITLPGAIQ